MSKSPLTSVLKQTLWSGFLTFRINKPYTYIDFQFPGRPCASPRQLECLTWRREPCICLICTRENPRESQNNLQKGCVKFEIQPGISCVHVTQINHCLKINSLNKNLKCALKFVVHLFKTHQNKVCLPHKLFQKFHDPKSDYYFEFISVFSFCYKKNPYTYTLEGEISEFLGFETSLKSLKVRQSQKQIILSSILQKNSLS